MEGFLLAARGGGQHLLASHPVLAARVGPLGHSSIQSWMDVVCQSSEVVMLSFYIVSTIFTSAEEIESVVSDVSTNSGWMVVE